MTSLIGTTRQTLFICLVYILSNILTSTTARAEKLCLYAFPEEKKLSRLSLGTEGRFALSFIHSVSNTPVRDEYELSNDGQIVQTAEVFQAHGAGLPSLSNELDASVLRHENGQFILELQRPIDTLIVRVQAQYRNALHINGNTLELATLEHSVLRLSACSNLASGGLRSTDRQ